MTVIAIINAETDPHIIADCLLSSDGEDHRNNKHVWIPSLGYIQTDWVGKDGPWHVVRLGRKTIVLPNNGGLLAFAGDCRPAFEFWAMLSEKFNIASAFDPDYLIDSTIIDQVLVAMEHKVKDFHILGVINDANGNRTPYTHRPDKEINTINFGTCYLAGSGTHLLAKLIDDEDRRFIKIDQWIWSITPTEELAESLCSTLLYYESDINNGIKPETPMHERFGGYYEWYGVKPIGVKPIPARVDLNLVVENDKIFITRLHLSESLQSDGSNPDFKAAQIFLRILSFAIKNHEINPLDLLSGNAILTTDQVDGVLIEQLFYHYDRNADSAYTDPRISSSVSPELLQREFGAPFIAKSLRLIIKPNDYAIIKGVRVGKEITAPVTIQYREGAISISLDPGAGLLIDDIIRRHIKS
jgi:hypothetical protein